MKVRQKRMIVVVLFVVIPAVSSKAVAAVESKSDYPVKPVPFTEVKANDTFWRPQLEGAEKMTQSEAQVKLANSHFAVTFDPVWGGITSLKRPGDVFVIAEVLGPLSMIIERLD